MRNSIQYFLICSIIIFSVVLSSCSSTSQSEDVNAISINNSANDEIVKMYQEVIDIKQKALEDEKLRINYGISGPSALVNLEMETAEARIELAQFQGDNEAVAAELEKIVEAIENIKQQHALELNAGQRPQSSLDDINLKLLEAKIRLAKAKLQ